MNFEEGRHFFSIDHFAHSTLYPNKELVVSCYERQPYGGGLFKINTKTDEVKQIWDDDFRGLCKNEHGIFVVNNDSITMFDYEYNKIETTFLGNQKADLHGVTYYDGYFFVVETRTNSIKILDQEMQEVDKVNIITSEKDACHINDILVDDKHIYLSMFSLRGVGRKSWHLQNGGIVQLDKFTFEITNILKEGLYYPHNLLEIDNQIYYCDSGRFTVCDQSRPIARFNGLTRGLAYDGKTFYIGQSVWRPSIPANEINVSTDCGVHIYDPVIRVSRFIKLPSANTYGILVMN